MTQRYRVSLGFARGGDHLVETTAMSVLGQMRVIPVRNARCYKLRHALLGTDGTPGPWQDGGDFPNSRKIFLGGLVSGARYMLAVCAVGGSTGHSDWSGPVSHTCI